MSARVEIAGHRFGRLLAIMPLGERSSSGAIIWLCRCECGTQTKVSTNSLRIGSSKSCGCMQKDAARLTGFKNTTHGYARTSVSMTYQSWSMMIQRCTNPKRDNYKYYGGRSVSVCNRWLKFEEFLKDLGERPSKSHCLSRNGDVGNYEPGNASWKLKSKNIDEMNARRITR